MRNARRVIVEGGDARVADVEECDACAELGYKLKPDSFDGTTPLRKFFSQFNLIAPANHWSDATKTVVFALCLSGKARSILETVQDMENLEFAELRSKLELRFGEEPSFQDYYNQFMYRKQQWRGSRCARLRSQKISAPRLS